jgi:large subunit ribosomal protein L30
MAKALKITLRRSPIGWTPRHREILRGLGLRRIGQTVIRPDRAETRGMVTKVGYLLDVEEVTTGEAAPAAGAGGKDRRQAAPAAGGGGKDRRQAAPAAGAGGKDRRQAAGAAGTNRASS